MRERKEGDPLREADTSVVLTLQKLRSVATATTKVHGTTSRNQLVLHVGKTSYDRKRAECVCRNLCGDNKWLAHSQQCMASIKPADDSCSFLNRVSCRVSVRKPSLTKPKMHHSIYLL